MAFPDSGKLRSGLLQFDILLTSASAILFMAPNRKSQSGRLVRRYISTPNTTHYSLMFPVSHFAEVVLIDSQLNNSIAQVVLPPNPEACYILKAFDGFSGFGQTTIWTVAI